MYTNSEETPSNQSNASSSQMNESTRLEVGQMNEDSGTDLPLAISTENAFLLNIVQNFVPPKDFVAEARGFMDVKHLLEKANIIIDSMETNFETITRQMVSSVMLKNPKVKYKDIQKEIFEFDEKTNVKIANVRRKIQSVVLNNNELIQDQSWLTLYCSIDGINQRFLSITRLHTPTNFGQNMENISFIILVTASVDEKKTKSALETARTFSTLFSNPELRNRLQYALTVDDFKKEIRMHAYGLATENANEKINYHKEVPKSETPWHPFRGVKDDFQRRIRYYPSDYVDGIRDARAVQKTIIFKSLQDGVKWTGRTVLSGPCTGQWDPDYGDPMARMGFDGSVVCGLMQEWIENF